MDHRRPTNSHQPSTAPSGQPSSEASVRAPSHPERCRTLAAQARSATLCTIARDPKGFPYGSLVTVAFDDRGRALMLLSELAEHTGNLKDHSEASVLVSELVTRGGEALALGRMTLLGHVRRLGASRVIAGHAEETAELAAVRATFLATQPSASYYVEFQDFAFYRLEPQAIRYVGGFGRMSWVDAAEYAGAEPDPLAPSSAGILEHMNGDHADALIAYATTLAGISAVTKATMTAVDRYGFEMSVVTPEGPRVTRLAFDEPVSTSNEVRVAMVALVKRARSAPAPEVTAAGTSFQKP